MWVYYTTAATSTYSSAAHTTRSTSEHARSGVVSANYSNSSASSQATSSTQSFGPWGSSVSYVTAFTLAGTLTYSNFTGSASDVTTLSGLGSSVSQSDLYATRTYATTAASGGTTTASGQTTTARTRAAYNSGTVTTTSAGSRDTTTAASATRTLVSGSTGGTVSATETYTLTTSTTEPHAATFTTYAVAASTTLTAPESLVPVSLVPATVQAWEVSATDNLAGFASQIGATFTARTGTVATTSRTVPVGSTTTYTTAGLVPAGVTSSLTTTYTLTASDTHSPFASVYPATATATRQFTLISTSISTLDAGSYSAATFTRGGVASLQDTRSVTTASIASSTVLITRNVSPTGTSVASLVLTWLTATLISRTREAAEVAATLVTTYSTTSYYPDVSTTTYTDTYSVSTTTTGANTTTATASITETYEWIVGDSTNVSTETCAISPSVVTASSTEDLGGGYYGVTNETITHDAPNPHTVSSYYYIYTIGSSTSAGTTSGTETPTTTVSFSDTFTEAVTVYLNYTTENNETQSAGISYTYPILQPQATANGSAQWTAHAMHARPGFRTPLELAFTDAHVSQISYLGGPATFRYPPAATQDGASGVVTPMLLTDSTAYESGVSAYTARYVPSVSRLYYTSSTAGATSQETGTLEFVGTGPATWYAPAASQSASSASRVGGIPGRSEFRAAVVFPPGVRHLTSQSAGTSSSFTQWLSAASIDSGADVGYAMPEREETAWYVTQNETSWRYNTALGFPVSSGSTSRPVVTLSLNPNL